MRLFFYIFLSDFLCGLKDRLLMIIFTFLLRFRSDITSCLFFSAYLIGLIATFFYRLITLIRWLNTFCLTRVMSRRKRRFFRFSYFFLFDRMIFFRRLCSIHCRRCNGLIFRGYCISRNHWSNKSQSNQYRCYPYSILSN